MPHVPWLDPSGLLLAPSAPVPLDEPFTLEQARAWGLSRHAVRQLESEGLLRRVLRGVYAASQCEDSVRTRAMAFHLLLPDNALLCDQTAGWLHGMPVLKRGSHVQPPAVDVCHVVDSHVRRPGIAGKRRFTLLTSDIEVVHGLRVTTPLRTALDLGRRLWKYDAIAAIDAALAMGVDHEQLLEEVARFKGQRGVVQLRALAPLGDRRSESPGESALRLRWYETGLPKPEPQYEITNHWGEAIYRLDVPLPELRFAAEYDGEEHHSETEDVEHDASRRKDLADRFGWDVRGFRKDDVYDPRSDLDCVLRDMFHAARRHFRRWTP